MNQASHTFAAWGTRCLKVATLAVAALAFAAKFLSLCRPSRAQPIHLNAMAAFHDSKRVHALRVGVRGIHGHDLAAIPTINCM